VAGEARPPFASPRLPKLFDLVDVLDDGNLQEVDVLAKSTHLVTERAHVLSRVTRFLPERSDVGAHFGQAPTQLRNVLAQLAHVGADQLQGLAEHVELRMEVFEDDRKCGSFGGFSSGGACLLLSHWNHLDTGLEEAQHARAAASVVRAREG